jgi:MOSC domain-containing protein
LGFPPAVLTSVNPPVVVALISGLTQMWALGSETEELSAMISLGCGGPIAENLLKGLMSSASSAQIASIYRYPVKGLTPEPLPRAELKAGQTLPSDRRYAIENGPSSFDPDQPKWLPKPHFLMLQRDEWLVPLRAEFNDGSHVLTLRRNGEMVAQGDLETAEGRAAIEQYFAVHHVGQIKGPPKVLTSPGHSFSDVARKVVSIINLNSLRAIEDMVGRPVHPLRFRANLYVEGWPAWREFELLDQTIAIGSARAKVVKRITRCAAVNVDPDTGARDLSIPHTLMQHLGHNECGVYAEVIADGAVAVGDTIAAEQSELT